MKTFLSLLFLLLATIPGVAGEADSELFETLHGHASFNVVFAVLLIILLGVLFSIWRLDRKVNKLMDNMKK